MTEVDRLGRKTEFAVAIAHVLAGSTLDANTGEPVSPADVFNRLHEHVAWTQITENYDKD